MKRTSGATTARKLRSTSAHAVPRCARTLSCGQFSSEHRATSTTHTRMHHITQLRLFHACLQHPCPKFSPVTPTSVREKVLHTLSRAPRRWRRKRWVTSALATAPDELDVTRCCEEPHDTAYPACMHASSPPPHPSTAGQRISSLVATHVSPLFAASHQRTLPSVI